MLGISSVLRYIQTLFQVVHNKPVSFQVFSFARNKVTRLPAYLAQFHQLEVLQIERNPIEWPPRSVVDSFGDIPDMSNGRVWIRKLQAWLEMEGPTSRDFDDSGYSEQPEWDNEKYAIRCASKDIETNIH